MLKAKNTIKSLHKTKNRLKQANCLFESKTNKTSYILSALQHHQQTSTVRSTTTHGLTKKKPLKIFHKKQPIFPIFK